MSGVWIVTPSSFGAVRSWHNQCTSRPNPASNPHQVSVVDIAAGAVQQVAVEN